MSVLETLGLFWVVLSVGVFTAAVLIVAVWSMTLGVTITMRRYRFGEAMESTVQEVQESKVQRYTR